MPAREAGEIAAILGAIVRNARRKASLFVNCQFLIVNCRERLFHERILRHGAENLDAVVDDALGHTGDLIATGEIGEFGRLHGDRGDVRVGERDFVREADRPRAVRSSGCGEYLNRHRLVDRSDLPAVVLAQTRFASSDQQDGLHQRDELVARRRADEANA